MEGSGPKEIRTGTLFAVAACALLSVMAFGTFMNDEGGQLHGLHNLRQGSLDVEERQPQYFAVCFEAAGQLRCGLLPNWDTTGSTGSLVASLASLPAYYLFLALDPLFPPTTLLLLAWAAATYVALWRAVPALHHERTGRRWQWHRGEGGFFRSMTPSHAVLLVGISGVLATGILTQPAVSYTTWGEVFAMQATHTAMTAVAAVLFFRLARHVAGLRAAAVASLFFFLGPVLFWGIGIKYHAPGIFLTVLALWLFQRDDRWRYAAFAVAVVGVANTELGLPLLVAMVGVEAWRQVARARAADRSWLHSTAPVAAVLAVPVAGVALINHITFGHWLGAYGSVATSSITAWMQQTARFESWSQSWANLWGVLLRSEAIEGEAVALLALTPPAVLAFLAPWRMVRQRCRDPVLWTAAASIPLFVAMAVHASHGQGTGFDNRFWVITVPAWLLLAAYVLHPVLADVEGRTLWRVARVWALLAASVLLLLWIFGSAGIALDRQEPNAQLLKVSWSLGTLAWIALLAYTLWGQRLRASVGKMRAEAWLARALALALVAPTIWLVMTLFIVHRSIPPWPFESGREGASFLLPGLEQLVEWATPHLIP